MIDINDYKIIYNTKIKKNTKMWFLILIFIIIGILLINNSFKYKRYYSNISEYKDGYLNIYVLIDDLDKITKNKEIIIDNDEFAYKINEISKENIYSNNNYYKEIKLSIDKKINENESVKIKIVIEQSSLLEYIFKTVWR